MTQEGRFRIHGSLVWMIRDVPQAEQYVLPRRCVWLSVWGQEKCPRGGGRRIALHKHPLGCPCLCRETLKTSGTAGLIEGFRAGLINSRAGSVNMDQDAGMHRKTDSTGVRAGWESLPEAKHWGHRSSWLPLPEVGHCLQLQSAV